LRLRVSDFKKTTLLPDGAALDALLI